MLLLNRPLSGHAVAAVRRAVFVYLVSWVIGAQVTFGLLVAGADLPGTRAMQWILCAVWPLCVVAAAFAARKVGPLRPEPASMLGYTIAGLGAYAYWALSYYMVAALTDPARVHYLPEIVEASVPLAPAWTLVYVGVHPLSVTPCFGLTDPRLLRRHAAGHAAIVAVSSLAWALFPVGFRRPELPDSPPHFGYWVLGAIYDRDPVINCMPSTHCAVAIYTASALGRIDKRLGVWALITAVAIDASTLFTKEHYLVDVIAGVAVGLVAARIAHGKLPPREDAA